MPIRQVSILCSYSPFIAIGIVVAIFFFFISVVFIMQTDLIDYSKKKTHKNKTLDVVVRSNFSSDVYVILHFLTNFFFYFLLPLSGYINDLCPLNKLTQYFNSVLNNKPEVVLGTKGESAVFIQQSWNSSTFKRMDMCSFKVDATQNVIKQRNRGLYITIRRLNLRKAADRDECIDYLQFKFGRQKTPKICGQLNSSVDDVQKIHFGESGGIIKVYIFIDKMRPLRNIEDTLDVELVVTAHEGSFILIIFC